MKKLTELTADQVEIYKLRKTIKDSFKNAKEDKLFNYTIEMYHLKHHGEDKIMKQEDYEIVRRLQDGL